jgi:hypothetical protein
VRNLNFFRRGARGYAWIVVVVAIVATTFAIVTAGATPSSFLELDGNLLFENTGTYDWANSGALTTTANTYSRAGSGGVFDGGHFNGNTTPPTAPSLTAAAAADPSIADAEFKVDPLSVDHTACGTGDPTAYTGAGSETNGDLLSTDTFGTASVPNKDDLSNVYALAHLSGNTNEVFFGAERDINNGDSHIDFEFLQSQVSIPAACSGKFSGNRSEGDFLFSVDFTTGGTLGGTTLYQWHCNADPGSQPADGTVCNPGKKLAAHYQQTGSSAVIINVNGGGNIGCGGWVCRNTDGSPNTTLLTNELMEGGIDLAQLGFTGCVSTFLPHTRSSQSFTATLKDFEIIPFNTCRHPSVATTLVPAQPAGGASIPATVHDTAQISGATASAGGTISYAVYSNSDCTGLIQDLTPTNHTVVNGVAPDSNPITFTNAGTYYFYAVYSGDSRNIGPVNSGCAAEPFTVKPNIPAVATTIVPAQPVGGASIPATVHDTAQITGATADAGGTISYAIYSNSDCTGLIQDLTPTNHTVVNGVAPDSNPITLSNAGTYYFYAVYSGDANNTGPVNSGCAAEPFTVKPNIPAVATTIVPAQPVGGATLPVTAHDTAQITGATANAGGTISYALYSNSDCTGLVQDLTPTDHTVVNGVAPDSNPYTFNNAGTFYFYAVYSGDANNTGPVNSGCASEPFTVNPNTPQPHSTPVVQIKDTLTVTGLSSNATGNVVVGLYSDSGCTSQLGTNTTFPVSGAVNGTLTAQTTFVTEPAGSYYYKISYAGDNNNTAFSSCAESVGITITSVP